MSVKRVITKQDLFVRKVHRLIQQENFSELKKLLRDTRPEYIATSLSRFNDQDKMHIFALLPLGIAGKVLDETDAASEASLLKNIEDKQLANVISHLPDDEAVDILDQLDEERRHQLLEQVKEREGIEHLMRYAPESAGGIMSTQFIAVNIKSTVRGALTNIRNSKADDPDLYHVIYVVDEYNHLMGFVTLARLLKANPARRISRIYKRDPIRVQPSIDQEEVARLVSLYNLINIPVVDETNKLIGVIYVEDVIDVITEEATEDYYKMAGLSEEEYSEKSVLQNSRIRLPWLFTTLIGSLLVSLIVSGFQPVLDRVLTLAPFMPVIAAMSGNVGIQSSSIVIRGLATGSVQLSALWSVILREFRVGGLVGLLCGGLVGVVVHFWKAGETKLLDVGLAVGVAMFCAMTVAATIGSLMPFMLKRMGVDPAIATGPFVTTLNDITGMTIYFTAANLLMG